MIKNAIGSTEHMDMGLPRPLRAAQAALRRLARADGPRPAVVVPDAVRAEQPTRSTSPSYVNLMAPLPTPAPRRPAHDDVVDLRDPR